MNYRFPRAGNCLGDSFTSEEESRMISKATIKKMTRSVTYQKGQELYYTTDLLSFNVNSYIDDLGDEIREISALAQGSYGNEYEVDITVNETTSEIFDSYCDCPAYENYEGLCKHCVAVLFEYLDRREKLSLEEEKDTVEQLLEVLGVQKGVKVSERKDAAAMKKKRSTSKTLKELLSQYSLKENAGYLPEARAGEIHLEPVLSYGYEGLSVRFRVGADQMYVVKNLYKMLIDIQEIHMVSYGKKLEFLHCMEAFDEDSRKMIHFLERSIPDGEMEYYRQYGVVMRGDSRNLYLYEEDLDAFMELFMNRDIPVEYHVGNIKETVTCRVVEESPMQKIKIRGEDGGIVLEHALAKGVPGQKYMYYISQPKKARIYRVDRQESESQDKFLRYMVGQRGKNIFIGEEELPVFCKMILPMLERNHKITMEDFSPEKYLPQEVRFEFYLDAPQKDMVTCKLLGVYGEQQYNLFASSAKQASVQGRDIPKEGYALSCVRKYFYAYDPKTETMALQGEEDIYCFLTKGIEELKVLGEVFISDKLKKIQVISKIQVQVGVRFKGNLLQMEIDSQQFSRKQLAEILSRYEQKKKYYRLKSGEFIRMDEEGMQVLYDLKENFQLTDRQLAQEMIAVPKYRALYLDGRLKGEGFQVNKSREFRKLIRDMKTIEDNDFEVPESLEEVLREYQKMGFLWMKTLCRNQFGGILADDMGLGKTLQTIAFLLSEFQEAGENPCRALIVTPASLVFNWKNEFERFAPELPVHTLAGTVKEREQILQNPEKQGVYITSYQLLYRDEELYAKVDFQYQVIDEAQFIKNQANQTTRAVKAVDARFRMALTGTPVENRLSELWSIFDYVMPGFLYKYQRFRKEIESPIVKNQDQKVMEKLRKMIQPFILRRSKKEVLKELPDKIERCLYAQIEGEQKEIYLAHAQRLQMQLKKQSEEEFKTSKIQILAELTRLRQICCDPALFYENYAGPSAKLELCMELIENAVEGGHKILLFSQFTTMLGRLTDALKTKGISYYLLTGATSKEDRIRMAESFNKDDTRVFCISLKAGGTGLNLTGADVVIHYDPWWNVAVENQATDRAHRIGQEQVVTVYKLIAKNTLEEKIIELQSKKKELAAQILGGEGISQASFSKEELLELLEWE